MYVFSWFYGIDAGVSSYDYLPKPAEPSVITKIKEDIDALKSAKWWEKSLPLILSLAIVAAFVMAVIFIEK